MTATSTCSSSQNLGFEGGGVGYFQVTVPANAVNVRVSATDTVGVDPTTGTHTSYGFLPVQVHQLRVVHHHRRGPVGHQRGRRRRVRIPAAVCLCSAGPSFTLRAWGPG